MSKNVILWISTIIVTFLVGFIQNRTSPTYPISGTIGIDGQRITYHLKKVCSNKNDFIVMIRTDVENLAGVIKWKNPAEGQLWKIDTLFYSNNILAGKISKQATRTEIEYKIILTYLNKEYFLPGDKINKIKFLGVVPSTIDIHYFLTLFLGILLAFRTGLEFFNTQPRFRLYSIFTIISFFSCAMIFAPIKKAYEMGAVGIKVPPLGELFEGWLVALVVIWIINLIIVSHSKAPKVWVSIFTVSTIIIFFSQNFF